MSTGKTEHLQLNQWAATDDFLREEFNEDNRKVDAGMVALAAQNPYACAEYSGDGVVNRVFNLGFRPSMVIFVGKLMSFASIGILASSIFVFGYLDRHEFSVGGNFCAITDTGFVIKQATYFNDANTRNNYIAFR